nr:purine-nucleoside phosphorylase [uncultured Schaedlerella sp.]
MKEQTPTIHNAAKKGEIARTVLMPGDPLRAKYIAETFLEQPRLVSDIRNMYCYTGRYEGREVSVMASGMGVGSMSIYSYELFHFYDVESIIRVGSAGGLHPSLKLKDIVVAMAVSTDSNYALHLELPGYLSPCGDYSLIAKAAEYGRQHGLSVRVGPVMSGEGFYYSEEWNRKWAGIGMLAVEMESAALYINAMEAGKKAVALCTISDLMFSGEACTARERQESFDDMIRMGLSMAEG